ncbi:putative membrane protein, clustering with ActP [Candidatus Burkholderia humilis]|nr:putative membrane protein, clustering with ActP [Candidatus Burkholderia humilis]
MDSKVVEKIKASAAYRELVQKRSRLGWTLTALVLIVYYGYVLLIAFDKDLLASKMGACMMTWGMPIGLFVIVFTVVITGLYVRHANSTYDDLTDQIKREAA